MVPATRIRYQLRSLWFYLEMLLWVVIKQLVGTRIVRSWGETLQINLGGTSTLASTSVCYGMISAGDIHDAGSAN